MKFLSIFVNVLILTLCIVYNVDSYDQYTTCVNQCLPRLDTYAAQSGIYGPPGPPGAKGEKGESMSIRKRYRKPAWKRCQSLTMNFPRRYEIGDYFRWLGPFSSATAISVCAGVDLDEAGDIRGTLASYSTQDHINAFLIIRRTVVFMNRKFKMPGPVGTPNSHVHFCAVVQSLPYSRNYWVYVNGDIRYQTTLTTTSNEELPGGGYFLIGQDQDSVLSGFESRQSYYGTITNFQLWYTWHNAADVIDIYRKSCKCKNYQIRPNEENTELFGIVSFVKTNAPRDCRRNFN